MKANALHTDANRGLAFKMKALGALLLMLGYLFFLALDAPARLLTRWLPPDLAVNGVSGTVWHGQVDVVRWRGSNVGAVSWDVTFSDLMPALALTFDSPDGPSGKGVIRGWQQAQLFQWQVSVPAAYVVHKLPLIVPVSAQGNVQLRLQQAVIDPRGCQSLSATLNWQDAALGTPLGTVALAQPQVQLNCHEGRLEMALRQQSPHVQITGKGSLAASGEYQFDGRLASGDAMPQAIGRILSTQGNADAQGGRLLRFQGRLAL
ncbi:type II secretion system protein N [Candidatus Symbiopectobacterium sp. NZEC127]|uniref:type II secretion system protein N n=1 Tax=Candidatus Symbiopectobacterium sp. NZEC127 TaxID=2820472 RepID=UPI002225D66F|nr:type II secretion system protein N [Candidatus Symbiopectobacterium sp. NZEC127]MCW2485987.1 type II secretion system protein N [Candidatus Symbiopectobacterium sp. NZEC127]